MRARRVAYLLLTGASFAGWIASGSRAALAFFVMLALAFLVSAALVLLAGKIVDCQFSADPFVTRGQPMKVTAVMKLRLPWAVGGAVLSCNCRNVTFGTEETICLPFDRIDGNAAAEYSYTSPCCGKLTVSLRQIRLYDLFGLCCRKVMLGKTENVYIHPLVYSHMTIRERGTAAGARDSSLENSTKPGTDHSSVRDLHTYRAGDPFSAIHWKLSGKFDDYLVKEYSDSSEMIPVLLVDPVGDRQDAGAREKNNLIFDVAASVATCLCKTGRHFAVAVRTRTGLQVLDVTEETALLNVLRTMLSCPVGENCMGILNDYEHELTSSPYRKIILVSAHPAEADLKRVSQSAEITALILGDYRDVVDEERIRMISVPVDEVQKSLNNVTV